MGCKINIYMHWIYCRDWGQDDNLVNYSLLNLMTRGSSYCCWNNCQTAVSFTQLGWTSCGGRYQDHWLTHLLLSDCNDMSLLTIIRRRVLELPAVGPLWHSPNLISEQGTIWKSSLCRIEANALKKTMDNDIPIYVHSTGFMIILLLYNGI